MNEIEIWKEIKNYEGLYQISNYGNVKSFVRKNGGELKQVADHQGYKSVVLCKDNTKKRFKIHKLVALNFIPNLNNLPVINHKNENKSNNKRSNLEWCDYSYNNSYGSKPKMQTEKLGKKINQFDKEGNFIKLWDSALLIQKHLGFNNSNIIQCCKGKRKTAGGFKWRYIDEQ